MQHIHMRKNRSKGMLQRGGKGVLLTVETQSRLLRIDTDRSPRVLYVATSDDTQYEPLGNEGGLNRYEAGVGADAAAKRAISAAVQSGSHEQRAAASHMFAVRSQVHPAKSVDTMTMKSKN
jgi:hypothetical protein